MVRPGKQTRKSMFLIAFGVVLYVVLENLSSVTSALGWFMRMLNPIVIGLCVSFVLNVFLRRLEKLLFRIPFLKTKRRLVRAFSVAVCLLLALSVIVLTSVVLVPKMIEAVQLVLSLLPEASDHIKEFISGFLADRNLDPELIVRFSGYVDSLTSQLISFLRDSSTSIAAFLMNSVMSAASSLINLVTGFLLAVYVLYHKETIQQYLVRTQKRCLSPSAGERVTRVAQRSFRTYSCFVEGELINAVILGVTCYLGLLVLGMPYAELISLMTAIFGLIPILGGWIAGAVSCLLIIAASPDRLLVFLIFFLVHQQLVGSLVYPRVVGSQMGLPSLLVLCAILLGQALFGMAGVLFLVPLTAVLYSFYKEALAKPATGMHAAAFAGIMEDDLPGSSDPPASEPEPDAGPAEPSGTSSAPETEDQPHAAE